MPLSGTIQEFGVADIFQLISQQAKTGRLSLSNGVETVLVRFRDGTVIHAGHASGPSDRLLGGLLVRAELVDAQQLEHGLDEQRRTLKRLGMVLEELGYIDRPTVREMARLQMTETLYSLFSWSGGTYEFETMPVEDSPDGIEPIRAENVVMNGVRITDEWPSIREQIPSYAWTVERLRPLPAPKSLDDDGLGLALSVAGDPLGPAERRVYGLIAPTRSVQKIIDLSRLGEFESCRALSELIGQSYARVVRPHPASDLGPSLGDKMRRAALDLGRVAVSAAVVVLAGGLIARGLAERRAPRELRLDERAIQRRLEAVQVRVLERALEVYRLRTGTYPATLEALVVEGLVERGDLGFPYDRPYHYALLGEHFILRTPLR